MPSEQPFGTSEIEALSASISPATGRTYGVQRVCRAFEQPRSSFYAERDSSARQSPGAVVASSGPSPSTDSAAPSLAVSASSRAAGAVGLAGDAMSPETQPGSLPGEAGDDPPVSVAVLPSAESLPSWTPSFPSGSVPMAEMGDRHCVTVVEHNASPAPDGTESSLDRAQQGAAEVVGVGSPRSLGKRGPKTPMSDADLLAEIRADLKASPFQGEGHRKVRARLKILRSIRVSNKRVLRLMRENGLLSPYRGRLGQPKAHDGTIVTDAPNVMWGTDGARIFTVEDGWVWVFSAVEHWNAECVGWHVVKHGTRFEALQPISAGLTSLYGSLGPDVARGLSLRMDYGSQYTADHFLKQIHYWGITASFAFVAEPQTNGVAERFNRTLKEQAIYGRVFKNLEEVRSAVADFVPRYNNHWRLEKLGYLSPAEARAAAVHQIAA